MKRRLTLVAPFAMAALLTPALSADVKTREHTLTKFEGMLGGIVNRFGGQAAKEGVTSTVAVVGNRKSSINDLTGQIIDLNEEKVYALDVKRKEYTVTTFEAMRQKMRQAQADAEKNMKDMKPEDKQQAEQAGKQMEVEYDVKETGQHKNIAGYDTHEVVVTITTHEKGKKIEDSGGMILTSDVWMGPKIAALDEIRDFEMKYFKAVYGEALGMDVQQMSQMMAMYPSMKEVMGRMQAEAGKMQGTSLTSSTTFDAMKSAEAMKAASDQQQQSSGGGSGFGSLLSKKLAGNRGGPPQQRATIMTTTRELLSVDTSASAADVAIPAGYKEKK